jgi:hypothetical protein
MAASVLAVAGMWRWGSPAPTPDPLPVSTVVESAPRIDPLVPGGSPIPAPPLAPEAGPVQREIEARVVTLPGADSPVAPNVDVRQATVSKPPPAPRIAPKAQTRLSSSTLSARCTAVLERMQLGEPVSDSERRECTR